MRWTGALIAVCVLACSETPSVRLEAVNPPVVSNLAPATVLLTGTGLSGVPTVDLDDDRPPTIDDTFIVLIGNRGVETVLLESNQLQVTLDAGFPVGTYDVALRAPNGDTSSLPQALRVTDQNVRGCVDDSDCVDPCHSAGQCSGTNECVFAAPDNPLCTFGTPALIAEISDLGSNDRSPTVTGDLLELYFESDREGGTDTDIFVSTRASVGEMWSAPTLVAELSTTNRDDGAPEISQDGLTIYLASNRDQSNQQDIYMSVRADRNSPWSDPVRVAELSTGELDAFSAPDDSNLRMVTRTGDSKLGDLFLTARAADTDPWGALEPIAELNTPQNDSSGFLEGDGLILLLASERTGGVGGTDLWLTTRADPSSQFFIPELVEGLSEVGEDLDPWISADGSYTVFASDRDGALNIYEAR